MAVRWTTSSLRGNGNVWQGVVTRSRSGLASGVLNVKFAVPPAETCVPAMTFLPSIRANVAGESIAPSVLRDLPGPSANLHNSSVWAVPPCAQSRTSIRTTTKTSVS